jgi:zinc transporter, ZIP family
LIEIQIQVNNGTCGNINISNSKNISKVRKRKRSHGDDAVGRKSASGLALLVGLVMDSIPKNMALGISLVIGGAVNIVPIAAIFISNFQEGFA